MGDPLVLPQLDFGIVVSREVLEVIQAYLGHRALFSSWAVQVGDETPKVGPND